MTGFSDEAWQRTAQLREAIHKLPFNIELAAGTHSAEPASKPTSSKTHSISASTPVRLR